MIKCYVAGALNAMAVDYIKNLHNMFTWAEKVRQLGVAVFIPGLDVLMGVMFGYWEYKDYFDNSQPWLEASDFVFVTPGWEHSEGTKREIARAEEMGIPVLYCEEQVHVYLEDPDNYSILSYVNNGFKDAKRNEDGSSR